METAIVVGGTSGIGLATARLFAESGARVVVTGRDPAHLAEAARRLGGGVDVRAADAADTVAMARLFAEVGRFEHLVLSIGTDRAGGPFRALDLGELRAGFEAKFWPQVTAARLALATIAEAASITFVTAATARVAYAGTAGQAAISGALQQMVPTLALELAPIRVNAVAPGVLDAPWWTRVPVAARDAMFNRAAGAPARDPSIRNLRPDDVARAIVMCATNGFITGAIIECDGGARFVPA